jgi:phosphoribosylanthranilate isomerase
VRIFVKICGITTAEALRASIEAGADALGFVFATSPRRITPEQAAELAGLVPPGLIRVAVMRHPLPEEWQDVAGIVRPDWLQTEARDFEWLKLPADIEPLPVYRDLPGLDTAAACREDRVLFESAASGTGRAPDWNRAREIARRVRVVLAGGLASGNVAAAIRHVRPWGVDVSSGVETAPGVKDPAKITAFVTAVRQAEQDLGDAIH